FGPFGEHAVNASWIAVQKWGRFEYKPPPRWRLRVPSHRRRIIPREAQTKRNSMSLRLAEVGIVRVSDGDFTEPSGHKGVSELPNPRRCGHRCDPWTVKLLGSFIPPKSASGCGGGGGGGE
ncbi:hypothetical protein DV515_00018564, partial [Chloebia gouldiae]